MKFPLTLMAACLYAMPLFAEPPAAQTAAARQAVQTTQPAPATQLPPAPQATAAEPTSAVLVGAQEYELASPETGRRYRIQVAAAGDQPRGGYPVLYVLDGDLLFPLVSMAAQNMVMRAAENRAAPLLIVGVGYSRRSLLDTAARAEDYTPPSADYGNTGDRRHTRFGGAEKFHAFLTGALRADIGRRFRIDPDRQAIFGHSYGGLFGVYALLNHPGSFRHYLIASPSIWWNGERVLQDWTGFADRRHPPVDVRLSVGEYEQTAAPHLPSRAQRQAVLEQRGMVRNVRRLSQRLATLPDDRIGAVETAVYPQETHASSLMPAISDGLKWLFARNLAEREKHDGGARRRAQQGTQQRTRDTVTPDNARARRIPFLLSAGWFCPTAASSRLFLEMCRNSQTDATEDKGRRALTAAHLSGAAD